VASHSLVDPDRYLGTVSVVTATMVQANMPFARAQPEKRALSRGAVGDFVFVDCEMVKLLGRIIEVGIPESERLTIEPSLGKPAETHPVGKILIFASVDYRQSTLVRGLRTHPRVGDPVYLADPARFGELIANALSTNDRLSLELGTLDAGASVPLRLLPDQLFGRHCGIFGATGGGKSWTLATVLSQIKSVGGKAILFDPTGEFAGLPSIAKHYAFDANEVGAIEVHFPYRQTTEEDLFALFRPSGQTQGPKLREAIRSLKLVKILGGVSQILSIFEKRLLVKLQRPRKPWIVALNQHKIALHNPYCDFAIEDLQEQLQAECVYNTDRDNTANWGVVDPQATSYCEGLNTRIGTLVYSNELACLLAPLALRLRIFSQPLSTRRTTISSECRLRTSASSITRVKSLSM
jgi:uncharacterized protein